MLGKIEGRRGGSQRIIWLDGIIDSMDMSLSKPGGGEGQRSLVYCRPWGCKELDTTEQLNNNDNKKKKHSPTKRKLKLTFLG